ncbi:PHP-associated domain-containing protein [Catenibacillus scindens]|nr:PHP-associated domain-containing protein [Catenibacillus scindens]
MDFHTHGKLAKKLPFSTVYTDWLFREAKDAGLDALCLTEHFNTLQFEDLYRYILSAGERVGDSIVLENGLRVFPGMETDICEGGHILCVGPAEAILELNRCLDPYKEKDKFLPFSKLMDLFEEYPVIVGAGHPFRKGEHMYIPQLPKEQLGRLHFIDLNGKDVALDKERTERLTCQMARNLGIPAVAGSDTHQAVQYGCIRTRFERDMSRIEEIYDAMKKGQYTIDVLPEAAFHVRTAGLLKRSLKEIYALGGDYVSVLVAGESI